MNEAGRKDRLGSRPAALSQMTRSVTFAMAGGYTNGGLPLSLQRLKGRPELRAQRSRLGQALTDLHPSPRSRRLAERKARANTSAHVRCHARRSTQAVERSGTTRGVTVKRNRRCSRNLLLIDDFYGG
jgi:hypothetical protein